MSEMFGNAENILNHGVCGFHQYALSDPIHLEFASENLCKMIGVGGDELLSEDVDLYEKMVHTADRRKYSEFIDKLSKSEQTLMIEYRLKKSDGTFIYVRDTATSMMTEGGMVCCSVLTDITDIKDKDKRYIRALADVYEKIFEFNLDTNTVKCIHCDDGSYFKQFENLAVQLDDAIDKWLVSIVVPEYQEELRKFLFDFCQKSLHGADGKPPQITYNTCSDNGSGRGSGSVKQYISVFIKIDESVSLFCCRKIKHLENDNHKEKICDLIMQFSDGLAAFELSPEGMVKPLYASDNVCEFFGYTTEEWLHLAECFTPLERFVAHSEAAYVDFMELLSRGEAEFNYFDYQSETERKIKAICSEKEPNTNASRYVMLYAVDKEGDSENDSMSENPTVSIRTFGYFDVFVGENPIAFRNKKSKELFALLVDRKGGYVTSEEAISFLWEDEPVNTLTLSRYRKVALRLKSTLEEYGISDVVEVVDGKRRIVQDKVDCDLFNYLSGKEEYANLFKGSYLTNYSWGETTLGELAANINVNQRGDEL